MKSTWYTSVMMLTLVLLGTGLMALNNLTKFSGPNDPIDLVLTQSAPHLPWIIRADGGEGTYSGIKYNYSIDENNARFQEWIDTYPEEVKSYKTAIEAFFNDVDKNEIPQSELDFYYDMMAQYHFISQLMKWESTELTK